MPRHRMPPTARAAVAAVLALIAAVIAVAVTVAVASTGAPPRLRADTPWDSPPAAVRH